MIMLFFFTTCCCLAFTLLCSYLGHTQGSLHTLGHHCNLPKKTIQPPKLSLKAPRLRSISFPRADGSNALHRCYSVWPNLPLHSQTPACYSYCYFYCYCYCYCYCYSVGQTCHCTHTHLEGHITHIAIFTKYLFARQNHSPIHAIFL